MRDFLLSNETRVHLRAQSTPRASTVSYATLGSLNDLATAQIEEFATEATGVRPSYLEAMVSAMESLGGSVDGYLEGRLGLEPQTREEMQNALLEVNHRDALIAMQEEEFQKALQADRIATEAREAEEMAQREAVDKAGQACEVMHKAQAGAATKLQREARGSTIAVKNQASEVQAKAEALTLSP